MILGIYFIIHYKQHSQIGKDVQNMHFYQVKPLAQGSTCGGSIFISVHSAEVNGYHGNNIMFLEHEGVPF